LNEPLFSKNRDLLNPSQPLRVPLEDGLVAAVRVASNQVGRILFAPNGQTLAVLTNDGSYLLDLASSRTRNIDQPLAWSPDGKHLAVLGGHQTGFDLALADSSGQSKTHGGDQSNPGWHCSGRAEHSEQHGNSDGRTCQGRTRRHPAGALIRRRAACAVPIRRMGISLNTNGWFPSNIAWQEYTDRSCPSPLPCGPSSVMPTASSAGFVLLCPLIVGFPHRRTEVRAFLSGWRPP
jgi:hypothetical protein